MVISRDTPPRGVLKISNTIGHNFSTISHPSELLEPELHEVPPTFWSELLEPYGVCRPAQSKDSSLQYPLSKRCVPFLVSVVKTRQTEFHLEYPLPNRMPFGVSVAKRHAVWSTPATNSLQIMGVAIWIVGKLCQMNGKY